MRTTSVCVWVSVYSSIKLIRLLPWARPPLGPGDGAQSMTEKVPYLTELRDQLGRRSINTHPPRQRQDEPDEGEEGTSWGRGVLGSGAKWRGCQGRPLGGAGWTPRQGRKHVSKNLGRGRCCREKEQQGAKPCRPVEEQGWAGSAGRPGPAVPPSRSLSDSSENSEPARV